MIPLHALKHYHLHVDQVRQNRNVHDYLADLDSEVPLYMKVELLNHHSSFSLEIVTVLLCLPHITGRPACQLSLQLDSSSFLRAFVASTDGLLGSKAFANIATLFLARLYKSKSCYLNLARLCKSNPFIWFQVLSLAVDLYQHCYWEVTIGRDM